MDQNFAYLIGVGFKFPLVRISTVSEKLLVTGFDDRITLEADAAARAEAINDLLDEVGKSVKLRTYNVTQVELAALVAMKPNEKPKSVPLRITHPNSCSLKYDDLDLKLRQMLVDSGIEPREPTESMEVAEAEAAEA